MEQISRRELFSRKVLGQLWQKTAESLSMMTESLKETPEQASEAAIATSRGDERRVMPEYFSSHMNSYALLSEMPWDMMVDEAVRMGIPYEGRSKLDIVRDIFLGTGGGEEAEQ